MRRHAWLAVVTAVLLGNVPARVYAAPPAEQGWIVSRIGGAARVFTAELRVTGYSDRGALMVVPVIGKGAGRRAWTATGSGYGYSEVGTDGYLHAYHNGSPADCPTPQVCSTPVGVNDSRTIDSQKPVVADYLIAANDLDLEIDITSPGWKARRAPLRLRVVRAEHGTATGARAFRTSIEHFTSAKLPSNGGAVWAGIPCGLHGTGSAALTGAGKPKTLRCSAGVAWYAYHDSGRPTTWALDGDVVGVSATVALIAALDYPRT